MPRPRQSLTRLSDYQLKIESLSHFLAEEAIDVCTLNETWLSSNDKFNIKNFAQFRKDRGSKRGGICILVRNSIISHQKRLSTQDEAHAICIKQAMFDKQDLIVATYYNTPDKTINPETIN